MRPTFICPGRISSPQTAPAPWPYNYRNRECPGADAGCTLRCAQSPYYSTLYGIKVGLRRRHERGAHPPLKLSPCQGAKPPDTPLDTTTLTPRNECRHRRQAQDHCTTQHQLASEAGSTTRRTHDAKPAPALHGSFLTRSGPPLTVREHQHQPDQHTPRRRQAFEGHRLGRLHGSFLTRSAPQPTTARQPWLPGNPARPSAARSSHAPGRSYHSQAQQARARPAIDMHHHWAALRFTLALASLDLGLRLGRRVDADDQTAPTTPAVPKSSGSSTRTCRPDASGIVAALMSCAFLSGCRS